MAAGTPTFADELMSEGGIIPSSSFFPPAKQSNEAPEAPRLTNLPDNPYAKYYRRDSKVWSLYLDETEAEDKEMVQVWKTGLDSLLVFAGLFAGVLAAFLLQSRNGLQEDPQLVLLREIRQALRNESYTSTSPPFHPSASSFAINFLWFISLTLTFVSALSAVIAKGWIDTYLPASAGKYSGEACERHLRAIRAYQWHLDGVLAAIPLLLQISLLPFLAGLVLFVFGDSRSIGVAVLALVLLTIILYVVVTLLPRVSPACPFRTTLSTFVPGTDKAARYRGNDHSSYKLISSPSRATSVVSKMISTFHSKPERATVELMILAWVLANSTREDAQDEAVKAIAGLGSNQLEALHSAMREYSAIRGLCWRLRKISDLLPGPDGKALGERSIITEACKQQELIEATGGLVPYLVYALKSLDTDPWDRAFALTTLSEISKHPELVKEIERVIPDIVGAMKDHNPWVCESAAKALSEISMQSELVKVIERVLLDIVAALKDTNPWVRKSAAKSVGEIYKQPELIRVIRRAMPQSDTDPGIMNALSEIYK